MFYITKPLSGAINDYVGINFVAKALKVSIDAARKMIKNREIPQPFKNRRGGYFWDRKEIDAFIANTPKGQYSDMVRKPQKSNPSDRYKASEEKRTRQQPYAIAFDEPKASERTLWKPGDEQSHT